MTIRSFLSQLSAPQFGGRPSGRFLILFEGRTGSTWLCNLLAGHPDIRCQHEILHSRYCPGGQESVHSRFRDAVTKSGQNGERVLGLKAKLNQVCDPDAFHELLVELHVDIIHMKRRNIVKQVVSELRGAELAQRTGQFNLYKDDDRVPGIAFAPEKFEQMFGKRLKQEARMDDFVGGLPLRKTRLYYEDLQVHERRTLNRVFSFLGVKDCDVQAAMPKHPMKHTSDDLREAVLNFDELKSQFLGTPYEAMFDEVLVPSDAGAAALRAA